MLQDIQPKTDNDLFQNYDLWLHFKCNMSTVKRNNNKAKQTITGQKPDITKCTNYLSKVKTKRYYLITRDSCRRRFLNV